MPEEKRPAPTRVWTMSASAGWSWWEAEVKAWLREGEEQAFVYEGEGSKSAEESLELWRIKELLRGNGV